MIWLGRKAISSIVKDPLGRCSTLSVTKDSQDFQGIPFKSTMQNPERTCHWNPLHLAVLSLILMSFAEQSGEYGIRSILKDLCSNVLRAFPKLIGSGLAKMAETSASLESLMEDRTLSSSTNFLCKETQPLFYLGSQKVRERLEVHKVTDLSRSSDGCFNQIPRKTIHETNRLTKN